MGYCMYKLDGLLPHVIYGFFTDDLMVTQIGEKLSTYSGSIRDIYDSRINDFWSL